MAKSQKYRIYVLLIFVMLGWGLNVTATKIIVSAFTPITITALRIFTASICVFIILFFLKKIRIPSKKELRYIVIASLLNIVGHHYFLSIGLSKTSASNGGLILGLGPILVTLVAYFLIKNRISLIQVIGIVIGLTGVAFIVAVGNGGLSGVSIGDVYVFLSIFTQAFSFVMIKKLSDTLDPHLMTGYMMLIGSGVLLLISFIQEPTGFSTIPNGSVGVWMIFFASAIVATAIGHMIYNDAIGKVGVTEAAIFINLSPFFSLVGAFIFLNEMITIAQLIGFLFILVGVILGSGALEEYISHIRRKKKVPYNMNSSV